MIRENEREFKKLLEKSIISKIFNKLPISENFLLKTVLICECNQKILAEVLKNWLNLDSIRWSDRRKLKFPVRWMYSKDRSSKLL